MLINNHPYDPALIGTMHLESITEEEIDFCLQNYLSCYKECMANSAQMKYFSAFILGLLSDLDRKSIEPIALRYMNESAVRGFQDFFKRGTLNLPAVKNKYQKLLGQTLSSADGMLCIDETDFPKKGTHSVGVARQYCGQLGKRENCQASVFVSYISSRGYGLVDGELYLPLAWMSPEYEDMRKACAVPESKTFRTKNEIAIEMVKKIQQCGRYGIKWIGCDSSFGSDKVFLSSLPEGVCYFANVKSAHLVFRKYPKMIIPKHKGAIHPRPSIPPISISAIAADETMPWEKTILGNGSKGPVEAEIKCLRIWECCKSPNHKKETARPGEEQWLIVRKYEDGGIKYIISNAPKETPQKVLNELLLKRWSIEQCFEECKSYLGMGHYETRSYTGWERHMQMVMIAHLATQIIRNELKKSKSNHANGQEIDSICNKSGG